MKKITLTEKDLTNLVEKLINERKVISSELPKSSLIEQRTTDGEHLDIHDEDVETIDDRILALEERLNELEADYVRKIGYGDHHAQTHKL